MSKSNSLMGGNNRPKAPRRTQVKGHSPKKSCSGARAEPRPLYRVRDILKAKSQRPVVLVGSEKAADAAVACGLLATTSAGGLKAAAKTDWSPLAGRTVWIVPDNDEAGERYAQDAARLCLAAGAREVRILDWSHIMPDRELPEHYDLADAVAECASDDERMGLRQAVKHAAELAEPWQPAPPAGLPPQWRPFPVDVLPEPVRGLVVAGAKAMCCDPAFIALPALAVLAGCVGNARTLRLKCGWDVPAILWTAVVAESGTLKTPAFRLALRALRKREQRAWQEGKQILTEYETALARWQREFARWKRSKSDYNDPPKKPERPIVPRVIVVDVTVERLATLLDEHPKGLLLARDELSGWLASFDRYVQRGQTSADATFWLSSYVAEHVQVDRKTGGESIYVPRAAMSVCGTIQPRVFARSLGEQHRENGLLARLFLAMPPRVPKQWTEAQVDPAVVELFGQAIDNLLRLEPAAGDDGVPEPIPLGLSEDAKRVWVDYYTRHEAEQADLQGELAAAWAKLEEGAARLALVVHLARWAGGDPTADPGVVDGQSMTAGVTLAEWFKHETRRVYMVLDETDEDRDRRRLVEWIAAKGGVVTARDVQMRYRPLREPGAAEEALNDLAQRGWGRWETVAPSGRGRPRRQFCLCQQCQRQHNSPQQRKNGNSVDVDNVDTVENHLRLASDKAKETDAWPQF